MAATRKIKADAPPAVERDRPRPATARPPLGLVALQRAAGNGAVTALIQHTGSQLGGATPSVQRVRLGTRVTHPSGVRSPFRRINATFDGASFTVFGDGAAIHTVSAQSGRPLTVRAADRAACRGTPGDSYLNNPRYVGIVDNGPIPEGEYTFLASAMTTFTAAEQAQMILGGSYTDPAGASLHGGDWGSGRVPLTPQLVRPSRWCGNTATRSGFYLHGGVMPGSSGCIDIGNDGFDRLVRLLLGFRSRIVVTVRYLHPPPDPGVIDRALGRFMYPRTQGHRDPSVWDRLGSLLGGDDQ